MRRVLRRVATFALAIVRLADVKNRAKTVFAPRIEQVPWAWLSFTHPVVDRQIDKATSPQVYGSPTAPAAARLGTGRGQ